MLAPEVFASRLPLRPDSLVLEIGQGSGYYSAEVAKRVPQGRLEVFDVQREMLERCRAKCESQNLRNVGYVMGDGAALPFGAGHFDVVYMVTVFGEIVDTRSCLQDVKRVLKPAGTMSIGEHLPDPDFTSFGALRRLTEKAGFVEDRRFASLVAYTANFRSPG